MKIIGIDVGLRVTGYAVMEVKGISKLPVLLTSGVYSTTPGLSLSKRLKELYLGMKHLMQKEAPEVAVYETIFYKKNPKTFSLLAQARGVLLLVAEELGIKVEEYTPAEIKQTISGSGRASKYQVHGMVKRLLGVNIPGASDIGDAVACALCYSSRNVGHGTHGWEDEKGAI